MADDERARWFAQQFEQTHRNLAQAIRGKDDVLRLALVCFFAEGHLLIEDVPGVGKTSLARAIAASVQGGWHRIQFTPDLLPSDVTGVTIYNQANQQFEFHPGPVFTNIVIGDEINRASPKTQSALLEVMEENRVTVDGRPHPVPRPFMVIATQNPVDMDGTYRLPEAQLDRFLIRAEIGYPDLDAEIEILSTQQTGSLVDQLAPVMTSDDVSRMITVASGVYVDPAIQGYIAQLAGALRSSHELRLAVSPRASLALMRAARALAASAARAYVTPEDIKELAVSVLAHRVILTPDAELQGRTAAQIVSDALSAVPVPLAQSRV